MTIRRLASGGIWVTCDAPEGCPEAYEQDTMGRGPEGWVSVDTAEWTNHIQYCPAHAHYAAPQEN